MNSQRHSSSDPFVHESSVVDGGVSLGSGVKIWHFCHVSEGAVIGEGASLGQNVFVGRGVSVGEGCKIQNNVSIYEGVTLEDFVFCGPSVVFTNVKAPRAEFPVGGNYAKTLVKRGASLGANATVICPCTLGESCFIGAGAVVSKDVPDFGLVVGNPGKVVGWVDRSGRRHDSQDAARAASNKQTS